MYQHEMILQSYRDNSTAPGINNSYLFVFACCRKQAAVKIPWYGEDCVGMNSNHIQTLGSSRVPHNTLTQQ